ncbi:RBR-type E3 ubiquitin transferase [Entamoeba marina]
MYQLKQLQNNSKNFKNSEDVVICDVCYSDFKWKEMCILPNCVHMFFWDCVKEHFKEKIASLDAFDEGYQCLEAGCSNKFTLDKLCHLKYITKEQYFSTLKLVFNRIVCSDENVIQCSNTACLNIYVEKKTGRQPTKCPECHKEFCIECKRNWHPNSTCEECHGFFCWRCMQKSYYRKHFNGEAWNSCKEWKEGEPFP